MKPSPQDFVLKPDDIGNEKGKRAYLNDSQTMVFMKSLEEYLMAEVNIPRRRMGKKQELRL